ncbi:thiamine pyrophosphate-binding protein [Halomicrococcus gelatinilyticus]|uniref:thiamine pyrophosphate-binding protein n=1 Tax=Halomicrococcus gelatinilyticus TaxID=1702103 RepID=UPI002E1627D6
MRLTDAVVGTFEAAGVDTVFGFPCEQMDPYYASLVDSDLRHVLARSEAGAAMMADGYARTTFRAGVVDGVGGPGAANVGVGLIEADGASSPVVAVTGDNSRHARGREVIQDADNEAILGPHVDASYDPETPARAVEAARQVVREAVTGVPSPTHLNLTEDVLDAEIDEWTPPDVSATFPAARPEPDAESVDAAVDVLEDAERPVIVAGEGALRSRSWDAVADLAHALDAPVATSMNGKGIVDETDDHAVGVAGRWGFCEVANDAVGEADAVLALGCRLGELTTVGWTLVPEDAALVHVDLDPAWLGKTYEADVPIMADVRATAARLAESVSGDPDRADRVADLADARREWFESHEDALESDDAPVKPQRVFREVERATPDDAVLVSATSFTGFFTGAFYRVREPGVRYLQARGSDGINYCLPQALGVQAGDPDATVVAVSGDGGIGYHIAELETAVREDLPVTVVVANNQSLGSSKISQTASTGTTLSTDFSPATDYAAVARGFGCEAEVVDDPGDLPDLLGEAVESDDPWLLDVRVDPYASPPVRVD